MYINLAKCTWKIISQLAHGSLHSRENCCAQLRPSFEQSLFLFSSLSCLSSPPTPPLLRTKAIFCAHAGDMLGIRRETCRVDIRSLFVRKEERGEGEGEVGTPLIFDGFAPHPFATPGWLALPPSSNLIVKGSLSSRIRRLLTQPTRVGCKIILDARTGNMFQSLRRVRDSTKDRKGNWRRKEIKNGFIGFKSDYPTNNAPLISKFELF